MIADGPFVTFFVMLSVIVMDLLMVPAWPNRNPACVDEKHTCF